MDHPEYGEVIQLQGDQRNNIGDFLVKVGLATKEQLKLHGFYTIVFAIVCCIVFIDQFLRPVWVDHHLLVDGGPEQWWA